MKPKTTSNNQFALFQANFKQILNPEHPLCLLADAINWPDFDAHFTDCYSDDMGRPGNAIRLMVGLHYLKHSFDTLRKLRKGGTFNRKDGLRLRRYQRRYLPGLIRGDLRGKYALKDSKKT